MYRPSTTIHEPASLPDLPEYRQCRWKPKEEHEATVAVQGITRAQPDFPVKERLGFFSGKCPVCSRDNKSTALRESRSPFQFPTDGRSLPASSFCDFFDNFPIQTLDVWLIMVIIYFHDSRSNNGTGQERVKIQGNRGNPPS